MVGVVVTHVKEDGVRVVDGDLEDIRLVSAVLALNGISRGKEGGRGG